MTDRKSDKPQKPIGYVRRRPTLDEVWPQGLSLDRGDIYEGNHCI